MKKLLVVMAVFVMAAGISFVAVASDVPAWQQALEPENYAGHVDLVQISAPIETGAVTVKSESVTTKGSDTDALLRSLEPENHVGHPNTY